MGWKGLLRRAGDNPSIRGAVAINDIIQTVFAIVAGGYVLAQWSGSSMLAPLVAIITAFVGYFALRIAMTPGVLPAVISHVRARLGVGSDDTEPPEIARQAPDLANNDPVDVSELLARERLLISAVQAMVAMEQQLEDARGTLEKAYSDRIEPNDSEQSAISNAHERWDTALIGLELELSKAGRPVRLALISTGYQPGLHPLQGYGQDTDRMARDARRFWDQATALAHHYAEARGKVKEELRGITRDLDRIGSR